MMISVLRRWQIHLILALLTLFYFRNVLLPEQGEALAGSDFKQFVYHIMHFMVHSIRHDKVIPLWNPHQFLGYSVVGNPQYLLFYLPNWLVLLPFGEGRIYQAVGVMVTLHTFWGAWGMARLAEVWGVKTIPALLAGVIFAFGAFPAARIYAGHYTMLLALAWLPWVLAAYRLALLRGKFGWALWGGAALAWQIAAGHPQITYLTALGLAVQGAYEVFGAEQRWHAPLKYGFVLGVVGIVLSAVAWLPIVDYNGKTVRGVENPSLEFSNEFAIPANQLTTLIVPDLYGNPLDKAGYWGEPFYEEMTAYVGWLPLLALFLVPLINKREAWFFAALVGLGIVLSLGIDGGLHVALYRWLPLAQGFRAPGRAMILSMVGLAGLLALTLTRLMENSAAENRAMLRQLLTRVLPLGLVILWGAALVYNAFDDSSKAAYRTEQLALSGLFLALAGFALWMWTSEAKRWALALTCLIVIVDVWRVSWTLTMTQPLDLDPIWREAAVDVPTGAAAQYGRVMQLPPVAGSPNGASWTGHLTPQGYDPLAPVEWAKLAELADFDPNLPINRLFGVRYALAPIPLEDYGFPNTGNFELIGLRPPFAFYENQRALPRVYKPARYEIVTDDEQIRQRIAGGETSSGELVFLSEKSACEMAKRTGYARITRYSPNSVEMVAEGSGLLVFSDQYDDDWRVQVNGKKANLLRVDTTLRGVCVPSDVSDVRFDYRPRALYVGGVISLIGWTMLLTLFIQKYAAIRRPRWRTNDQHD